MAKMVITEICIFSYKEYKINELDNQETNYRLN